jgi:hypothetical protein
MRRNVLHAVEGLAILTAAAGIATWSIGAAMVALGAVVVAYVEINT